MKNILILILMLISFILSILVLNDYLYFSVIFLLINLILSFFIVNNNNLSKNIINPQTVLLLGFSVLILGRFIAVLLDKSYLQQLFCINFIFYYCSTSDEILRLFLYLHSILISFSVGFILLPKNKKSENLNIFIEPRRILILFILGLFSTIYLIFENFGKILLVLQSGYLALYDGQSEEYETPISLVINSLAISCLALLYSMKKNNVKVGKYFYILFCLFLFKLMMAIGTGSRSHFIAGIILLIWYIFHEKKLNFKHYIFLYLTFVITALGVNSLAALSGVRAVDNIERGFLEKITFIFYNQGTSLMVFDISLRYTDYPILGYLKVALPGIQVLYGFFGVNERKDFNWSSYVVYNENMAAYFNGNGLGWSLYSDFYAFSFGSIFAFCFLVFLFARLIVKLTYNNNLYCSGIVLILVSTFFTINRASISGLIFILIIYSFLYLFFLKLKVR
ncbi:O-antigen polymerase [Acinetobacter baumannii]|uniref:O-antigen polymerase n=1 Tax=Acinetobacter baumannii TaxID=470 RepID=UPI003AF934F4